MTDIGSRAELTKARAHDAEVPATIPLALGLAAGFVDVCTFLAFSGLFVAQLTGSFVVAGAFYFEPHGPGLAIKLLAIPIFLVAGIAITLVIRALRDQRAALLASLAVEIALLEAMMAWQHFMPADGTLPAAFGLAAMGVQSASVRLLMASYGSTNVLTSNTTQLGIEIADGLRGLAGHPAPGLGGRMMRSLVPMLAFFAGTVLGAAAFATLGLASIWFVIGELAMLGGWIAWRRG